MGQKHRRPTASSRYDPSVGDLKVDARLSRRLATTSWTQAALTVEGKIGNFDITYAGAYLKRDVDIEVRLLRLFVLLRHAARLRRVLLRRRRRRSSIRRSTSRARTRYTQDQPRAAHRLAGRRTACASSAACSAQQQTHDIQQRYKIDDLADVAEVTGWPDTIWLTKQVRDRPRLGRLRRADVRHHRQADRHRGVPLLPSRELAEGLLRLRRRATSAATDTARRVLACRRRPGDAVRRRAVHEPRQDASRRTARSAKLNLT